MKPGAKSGVFAVLSAIAFAVATIEAGASGAAEDLLARGVAVLGEQGVGGTEEALALFEECIAAQPDHGQAHLLAARACLARAEAGASEERAAWLERGRRYADRLLSMSPDDADARVVRAQLLLDAGDRGAAVADLDVALRADPANPAANAMFLACLVDVRDERRAVLFARASAARFKGNAEMMKRYGFLMLEGGWWSEARFFLNLSSYYRGEGDPETLEALSVAYFREGAEEQAAAALLMAKRKRALRAARQTVEGPTP